MCAELKQHWEAVVQTVASYIRSVALLISRADSCCLAAGVWTDRWPLWEREERVLSTSLPLRQSWNTAYITNTSAWLLYEFVPQLPPSAQKWIKEMRFYVRSQELNLWWPLCVENASLLILYAVGSYMALASYSGTLHVHCFQSITQCLSSTSYVCLK